MDVDALRIAAGLKPLPYGKVSETPAKPERGHARGTTDDRRIQDKGLRGIPCVGAGPGVIEGTRPGDSVKQLEQAERDIALSRQNRNRFKKPKENE